MDSTKLCPKCKTRPRQEYAGRASYCRECNNECHRAYRRTYYQKNKGKKRQEHVKYTYGLSVEEYEKLKRKQHDRCAICKQRQKGIDSLNVDHDHSSGVVRGLLCHRCNLGAGLFQDDPRLLRAASRYLRQFNNNESLSDPDEPEGFRQAEFPLSLLA